MLASAMEGRSLYGRDTGSSRRGMCAGRTALEHLDFAGASCRPDYVIDALSCPSQ